MAAAARTARAIKPAWWLLSEDLELEGDVDEPTEMGRNGRASCTPTRDPSSPEQKTSVDDEKVMEAESVVKEAVNHAVRCALMRVLIPLAAICVEVLVLRTPQRLVLADELHGALSFSKKATGHDQQTKAVPISPGIWRRLQVCSKVRPVRLHYGHDSMIAKLRFTYERRNFYGNITTHH
jgi:hypothetical protein